MNTTNENAAPETHTFRQGQCQLCERIFRLRGDHMVNHGYTIPDGQFEGVCPGANVAPYELSCDVIKFVLAQTERSLVRLGEYLAKIDAGEVTEFVVYRYAGYGKSDKRVELKKADIESYRWTGELAALRSRTMREIEQDTRTIKHLTARIAGWKLVEIAVLSEEAEAKRTADERAARTADLAAARKKKSVVGPFAARAAGWV